MSDMTLGIYSREDIANALLAAHEASASTAVAAAGYIAGNPTHLRAFREGYKAALITVALAFGLKLETDTSGQFGDSTTLSEPF